MLGAPGKRLGQDVGERDLGVDRPRVDLEHRLRPREPPPAGRVTLLLADEIDQVDGVGRVEDAEARARVRPTPTWRRTIRWASEWNVPPAIRPAFGDVRSVERARPLDHLAGCAPRERQQEDPLGRDA